MLFGTNEGRFPIGSNKSIPDSPFRQEMSIRNFYGLNFILLQRKSWHFDPLEG